MECKVANYGSESGTSSKFCDGPGAGIRSASPDSDHQAWDSPRSKSPTLFDELCDIQDELEKLEASFLSMLHRMDEGPSPSDSSTRTASPDSVEKAMVAEPLNGKNLSENFPGVIDLTSEDDSDSVSDTSPRKNSEPMDLERVKPANVSLDNAGALIKGSSASARDIVTISSDDDEVDGEIPPPLTPPGVCTVVESQEVPYTPGPPTVPEPPVVRAESAPSEGNNDEDPLNHVWANMPNRKREYEEDAAKGKQNCQGLMPQFPSPISEGSSFHRKKTKTSDTSLLLHSDDAPSTPRSQGRLSIQLAQDGREELVPVALHSDFAHKTRRCRGIPGEVQVQVVSPVDREYDGTVHQIDGAPSYEIGTGGMEVEVDGSEPHDTEKVAGKKKVDDAERDRQLAEMEIGAGEALDKVKEREAKIFTKRGSHRRSKKERKKDKNYENKRKTNEDLIEEEFDESDDEQSPKNGKRDAEEDLMNTLKSNLQVGEVVPYVPYKQEINSGKEDDQDPQELDEMFNEMKVIVDRRKQESLETERSCKHDNYDYDADLGYYCGSFNIPIPSASAKTCSHVNWLLDDATGYYCEDCGKTRDIEKIFLITDNYKSVRKRVDKVMEKEDLELVRQFQLTLHSKGSDQNFCAADFRLHPYFEELLHPHQKVGFKFMTKNLLGGQKQNHEALGCVLAHAPGTGKTRLVISWIQSYLSRFKEGRPLILAPKIMLSSWQKEFRRWKVQDITVHELSMGLLGGRATDASPADVGFEEQEEEEDLPVLQRLSVKESRAHILQKWQEDRSVLLMSYTLFANMIFDGDRENVAPGSLEYQMSKILREVPNLIVLDEGHLARNGNTKITQMLQRVETKRRVLLSGTLFQNNFKELYTVLKLCRHDFMVSHDQYALKIAEGAANLRGCRLNGSLLVHVEKKTKKELMQIEEKLFTEEIGEKLEAYVKSGETIAREIQPVVEKLQDLTAPFVDWYPGEILESLPGLIEYSIHLRLTPMQLDKIDNLPQSKKEIKHHHMSRQCKLSRVCIHPSLVLQVDDETRNPVEVQVKKRPPIRPHEGVKVSFVLELVKLCQSTNEKILIFCATLAPLECIEDVLCQELEWQREYQMLRLDGRMQESNRQTVIDKFNRDDFQHRVLMASTKACKEGITLVGASRVVILDNPDNPSVVRQAVSRAFRIGQKKKVYVYRLVADNREEELIFRRSVNKERLALVLSDPVSTMAKLGGFLQDEVVEDIQDEMLQKMVRQNPRDMFICVNRYNAPG